MKKFISSLTVFAICIAIAFNVSAVGFSVEKAAKSVVKLFVYTNLNDEDYSITGSGFVAFNSKTLITNYHVIEEAVAVYASDDNDNVYELDRVLCADKIADIAILEFSETTDLQPLDLYADDHLERGAQVIAIGSPKGLKNSVSNGIVSYQYDEDGIPMIQITAPISPGSSGGALFNDDGKVIGVTSAIYNSKDEYGEDTNAQNLNFAVNIAVAKAMYKAWDGTKYTLGNHKSTAKMDFTDVYKHDDLSSEVAYVPEENQKDTNEVWICLKCGKENSTKFCQNCGAEKPIWICSCGKVNSSNQYCGECGNNCSLLIESFNEAVLKAKEKDYTGAVQLLESLGRFDSGSYDTIEGNHIVAQEYIGKVYYEYGIYLQSNNGDHDMIIEAFMKAGGYSDAKDQIAGENALYLKALYDKGIQQLNDDEFDEAIVSFQQVGEYQDAAQQIINTYYAKGLSLLNAKDYEGSRIAFEQVGDYQNAKEKICESYYLEAEDKLAEKEYAEAVSLFTKAVGYSDSSDRISEIYYEQGTAALESNDIEKAKEYFVKAGDYKDSQEKIKQIDDNKKNEIYVAAVSAYENGEYKAAYELFAKIPGYADADEKAIMAKVADIKRRYDLYNTDPETMQHVDQIILSNMLNEVSTYKSNETALLLYKSISYTLAKYNQKKDDLDTAIRYYRQADDYSDASEMMIACMLDKMDALLEAEKITQAIDYYQKNLIAAGYTEPYYIVEQGREGLAVKSVFSLIKPLGIKAKLPAEEDTYKEEYIKYVQKIEEHFGMVVDGRLSLDEYTIIRDAIYQGCDSQKVADVLEQLADLSYIKKLSKEHSKYEAKYVGSIKAAEKELGLLSDGIITKAEYETIMSQKVASLNAPSTLTVKTTNDTVSLSWTRVDGAVCYEVYCDGKILGTTEKTSWTEKNVKTGVSNKYMVRAKKYTVSSAYTTKYAYISPYYKSVTAAQLTKELNRYKDDYVKMSGLRLGNWSIETPTGEISKDINLFYKARHETGYNLYLLCYSGNEYVELIILNYSGWDWENDRDDLLAMLYRISSLSMNGYVQESTSNWTSITNVPSVILSSINWRY